MIRREISGKYKGSVFGIAWSFFNPVLMLIVYTFVFSEIFQSRWNEVNQVSDKSQFAVILFVGMIAHSLMAEVMNRSPKLILDNTNYVKKVVFPLEILSLVNLGVNLFHTLISFTVLIFAFFAINHYVNWTIVFVPFILLPVCFLSLGFSWFLAALGVYLRDISQMIGIITTILMFLAPVFYPSSAIPLTFRPYLMLNPLTFAIEELRQVVIWGNFPDLSGLCLYTMVSLLVAWLGYAWFQKTRKGFADVI